MEESLLLMEISINYSYATVCNAEPLFLITLQYQVENWNYEDLGTDAEIC